MKVHSYTQSGRNKEHEMKTAKQAEQEWTDWLEMLREKYDELSNSLKAEGWQVQNEGMSFCEHFTHQHQAHPVHIVRQMGSPDWYVQQYHGKRQEA